jgi:hypothetical protein
LGWKWVKKSLGKKDKPKQCDRRKRLSTVWLETEPLEERWLMTTVQFGSIFAVDQSAGKATIPVTLNTPSSQTITVDYATSDGTAVAGTDYSSASGTLTFPAFTTSKNFTVLITDEGVSGSSKTINLALSNPTNATLGSPSTGSQTINYSAPSNWLLTGQERSTDPQQGLYVPFGAAEFAPQTGGLRVSQAFDVDQSPGTAVGGSPALVYLSDTVDVHPVLEVTVPSDGSDPVPTQIQARLTWNSGTPQSWVTFATTGHSAGDNYVLALQTSSAVSSTGYYPWQIDIDASFSGRGDILRSYSGNAMVVANGSSDAFGQGWGVSGLDQLVSVSGGVIWVSGTGGTRYLLQPASVSRAPPTTLARWCRTLAAPIPTPRRSAS